MVAFNAAQFKGLHRAAQSETALTQRTVVFCCPSASRQKIEIIQGKSTSVQQMDFDGARALSTPEHRIINFSLSLTFSIIGCAYPKHTRTLKHARTHRPRDSRERGKLCTNQIKCGKIVGQKILVSGPQDSGENKNQQSKTATGNCSRGKTGLSCAQKSRDTKNGTECVPRVNKNIWAAKQQQNEEKATTKLQRNPLDKILCVRFRACMCVCLCLYVRSMASSNEKCNLQCFSFLHWKDNKIRWIFNCNMMNVNQLVSIVWWSFSSGWWICLAWWATELSSKCFDVYTFTDMFVGVLIRQVGRSKCAELRCNCCGPMGHQSVYCAFRVLFKSPPRPHAKLLAFGSVDEHIVWLITQRYLEHLSGP